VRVTVLDDVQVVENEDGDADRDDTDGNEIGVELCGPSSSDIQASYEKALVYSNIEIARKGEEYEDDEEDKKKRDKASGEEISEEDTVEEDKETFEKAHFSDAFKVLESILNAPSLVWISEKDVQVEKTSELMNILQCMGLDKRDATFIANKQKHKSLIQRHYDAKPEKKDNVANPVESPDKDDAGGTMLRRGSVVDVNVGKGKTKRYAIMGISQKFSNKWFRI